MPKIGKTLAKPGFITTLCRPFSISKPLRGCNSDLAHYSNTPILHHSTGPDSRTRTTTRTRTKRLVRAGHFLDRFQGLKPLAESLGPFGTKTRTPVHIFDSTSEGV